jgi:hypothetical protein
MPVHTIKFNLPEEQEELDTTLKASSYSIALSDIDNLLRSKIKYGGLDVEHHNEKIVLDHNTLEWVRSEIWKIKEDNGVLE